jgi:hypothetical protein
MFMKKAARQQHHKNRHVRQLTRKNRVEGVFAARGIDSIESFTIRGSEGGSGGKGN